MLSRRANRPSVTAHSSDPQMATSQIGSDSEHTEEQMIEGTRLYNNFLY